mgnify:FL=1
MKGIFMRYSKILNKIITVSAAVTLLAPVAATTINPTTNNVQAATKSRKLTHNAYIYKANGKRANKKILKKGTYVKSSSIKKIKGKNYYHIGKNQYIKVTNTKKQNHVDNTSKLGKYVYNGGDQNKVYKEDTIKLPSGYNDTTVQEAVNNPSILDKQTAEGNKINKFVSESKADDDEKVDPTNLTTSQKQEINKFAIRLLNEARVQAGVNKVKTSQRTLKLALDVANEYQINNRDIFENGKPAHYIPGIVKAARENGVNIDDNYIEDAAIIFDIKPQTMTELKNTIYINLLSFLFNKNEYYHASDILDPTNVYSAVAISYAKGSPMSHWIKMDKDTIENYTTDGTWN